MGSRAALGSPCTTPALAALVGALLLFAVPRALSEVQGAISSLPETRSEIHGEAAQSTGLKRDVLTGLERRLSELPSRDKLVEPGVAVTLGAVEVFVAVFFVFAAAAYWISERDRVEQVFLHLASEAQRGARRRRRGS